LYLLVAAAGCNFSVPSGAVGGDARDDGSVDMPGDVSADAPIDAQPLGPFTAVTVLSTLSTAGNEDDPTLTGDMLEIYFERSGDIYYSVRTSINDPWPAGQMVTAASSASGETTPEVTLDGLELFFASTRGGGAGGTDIYVTTRANRNAAWGNATRVAELDTASEDVTPTTIGSAALLMYLSSTRPGGGGGYDLWRTTRPARTQPWAAPVWIPSISSAGTETEPWVDLAETTIYISADGLGGRDLYTATRTDTSSAWGALVPVAELNSAGSEEDPWLSPDGHTMFFASSRAGSADLYMATR
jgi:hypothetical protein